MKRFRALAALLGCLAVLAGGFATVAAAAVPSGPPVSERTAIGAPPCGHCEDCGGVPCPAPTVSCVQACASVAPSLAVEAFRLPAIGANHAPWSPRVLILSGLSPPPEPIPPRA
jgi:hypothetical protein